MKGFKNKPAVLPAAEPSAAKLAEDEDAPETRFQGGSEANGEAHLEGGAKGSGEIRLEGGGEAGIAGHKKKRAGSGLPPWLHVKPQDRWPLVRVVLVVVLCISAGWYFVDFYGGKDAQAGQALPRGGVASASASRAGARGMVSATQTSTPTPSASVKWTPTAQEAKKRAEALSMPLPAKPEEITQNTDDGAVATAKYAIELYNYTYATGHVDEYKSLCVSEKRSCVKTVASVQRLHNKGNVDEYKALCISDRKSCVKVPVDTVKMHQNGGWVDPIQVTFVSGWVRKDVTKNVVVQLWFYRNASQEHSGQGELQDIPAGKFASLVTLKFDGVEWKVQEIYVEEK